MINICIAIKIYVIFVIFMTYMSYMLFFRKHSFLHFLENILVYEHTDV